MRVSAETIKSTEHAERSQSSCGGEGRKGKWEAGLSLSHIREAHGLGHHPCTADSPCLLAGPQPECLSPVLSCLLGTCTWGMNRQVHRQPTCSFPGLACG